MTEIGPNTTSVEALEIALAAEEGAIARYASFAEQAANLVAKNKFSALAHEEKYHKELLLARYKELTGTLPTSDRIKGSSEVQSTAASAASALEAVELALKAEESAIRHYRGFAEKTGDETGKAMFKQLAKDEERHAETLRHEIRLLKFQWYWPSIDLFPWDMSDPNGSD